jgi:hypothetical protein
MSAAATVATPALEQLGNGVSSPRALRLLGPLRDAMAIRRGDDAFADHYDAVHRHLEAVGA